MIKNYKSHFSRDRILDRYSTRCIYRGAIFSLFDKEMKENLSKMYHKSVSTSTISRHLHEYGYKNVQPQSTQILTSDEKERRVQWAKSIKMMILLIEYLLMNLHSNFFVIRSAGGRKFLIKNLNAHLKIVKKFMSGVR